MAKAQRKQEFSFEAEETQSASPLEPLKIIGGLNSPARRLQSTLEQQWDAPVEDEAKWPVGRTVAFVFVTCSLFWGGIFYFGQAIF